MLPFELDASLMFRPAAVGGFANRVRAVHAVVEAGVAVMGHVGLTPQVTVVTTWPCLNVAPVEFHCSLTTQVPWLTSLS